ncbi:hypothetical protein BJ508DRAFT_313776 [Ascobolus immersus RN42]|uniref:C2H2-type domain-containing protein n=1 Tax=Ascobolus immersus RN42 TaxID=1160509 RepID=A0A3N4HUY7_ASCIM|nr:hypothetical protein BJ508DRAFT_313776 [Ascobolus immersus RN42]
MKVQPTFCPQCQIDFPNVEDKKHHKITTHYTVARFTTEIDGRETHFTLHRADDLKFHCPIQGCDYSKSNGGPLKKHCCSPTHVPLLSKRNLKRGVVESDDGFSYEAVTEPAPTNPRRDPFRDALTSSNPTSAFTPKTDIGPSMRSGPTLRSASSLPFPRFTPTEKTPAFKFGQPVIQPAAASPGTPPTSPFAARNITFGQPSTVQQPTPSPAAKQPKPIKGSAANRTPIGQSTRPPPAQQAKAPAPPRTADRPQTQSGTKSRPVAPFRQQFVPIVVKKEESVEPEDLLAAVPRDDGRASQAPAARMTPPTPSSQTPATPTPSTVQTPHITTSETDAATTSSTNKRKARSSKNDDPELFLRKEYKRRLREEMMEALADKSVDLKESKRRREELKEWFEDGLRMLEEVDGGV